MRILTLLFVFLFSSSLVYSQNDHKFVKLEEVKKGKRLDIYANNTDSISYDVFLKVDSENHRRSSNRPIIRTIAPQSKVKLMTLIQLNGKPENYNSIFIVNEVAYTLDINKDRKNLDIKLDKAIKARKVIIYTKDDCTICPQAKSILSNNKIAFEEYNIDKDTTHYNSLIREFKVLKPNSDFNRIPILKVEDNVFNDIKTIDDFIASLREGLK